jgi:hypothetical protein
MRIALIALALGAAGCGKPVLVHFPQAAMASPESNGAMLKGELKLEGKCLKVEGRTIIWPATATLDREKPATIANGITGTTVTVGDTVLFGGGEAGQLRDQDLKAAMLPECVGLYWVAGQFEKVSS